MRALSLCVTSIKFHTAKGQSSDICRNFRDIRFRFPFVCPRESLYSRHPQWRVMSLYLLNRQQLYNIMLPPSYFTVVMLPSFLSSISVLFDQSILFQKNLLHCSNAFRHASDAGVETLLTQCLLFCASAVPAAFRSSCNSRHWWLSSQHCLPSTHY